MKRLTQTAAQEAIQAFADYRYPNGCPAGWAEGVQVVYRDDSGESSYQVTDADGRGDGTGEWHPVEEPTS